MPPKKEKIELEGKKITIKKDALRDRLGLKANEKFNKRELQSINKTEVGDMFKFRGKSFKMTELMKKRITLAITLMSRKK